MKALFLRSLLAALLLGPIVGFIAEFASFHKAVKYDPPISEAEFHQMGNMTANEMQAALGKRRIVMTRWQWLRDSASYSYFWKAIAHNAVPPASGVFVACIWVGWMEQRRAQRLRTPI